MPRDLPLGNGTMQAHVDLQHRLVDLYDPCVDGEHPRLGHQCRLGMRARGGGALGSSCTVSPSAALMSGSWRKQSPGLFHYKEIRWFHANAHTPEEHGWRPTWRRAAFVHTVRRCPDRLHAIDPCPPCGPPQYRRAESHLIRARAAAPSVRADPPGR